MATNPETEQSFAWAKALADKISKAQQRLNKTFDAELSKEIPEAIKENDDVIIKLKLQSLQNAIHGMEENLEDTLRAVDWMEKVNEDDAFSSEHHEEFEAVTMIITDARAKLTHQIEAARKLEITARKGLETAADSKEVAERDFDEIELRILDEKKYMPATLQKAEDAHEKTQQALAARDSSSLGDTQKAMSDLGIDSMVLYHEAQDFENRINTFLKKTQAEGLEDDLMSQFKDGSKKLLATNEENAKDLKQLSALNKWVKEAKIDEIDVKKAIKALQIDPKIQSKVEPALSKVLKGPGKDFEKGLEGIARQFRLPTPGKQMLATLKKAGEAVYK